VIPNRTGLRFGLALTRSGQVQVKENREKKFLSNFQPFIEYKFIWIKSKFKFWIIPIRKIKYKITLSHNKIAAAWMQQTIIYLFK
jgi:hypothetical protein